MSRETRLLVATILVSAVVLVALSRFRFPERPPGVTVPPAPLERLARATYDELSGLVAGVVPKISPGLLVVRFAADVAGAPRTLADVLGTPGPDIGVSHVPALRVSETTAVAAVPAYARVLGIVGHDSGSLPHLVAADPIRRLALVRVPPDPRGGTRSVTMGELQAPAYVIVVEGTRAGLTFRPVFVGGSDRFLDPRWEMPLLAVSSTALTSPGAFVFSLDGQFLGFAVVEGNALAIASAREVVATADRLSALGSDGHFDAGITVQPLTTALAAALGVARGVVIAEVDSAGPAAALLEPADVVTAINGREVDSPDELLLRLAQQVRGKDVALTLVRHGESQTVVLPGPAASDPQAPAVHGLAVQARRGVGTVVTSIVPGSVAEAAGLVPGDVIVRLAELDQPTPAQVSARLNALKPGTSVAVTIERAGRQRVLALPQTDAPQ